MRNISLRFSAQRCILPFAMAVLLSYLATEQIVAAKKTPMPGSKSSAVYFDRAHASIEVLNQRWLLHNNSTVTWNGINAWQRFVIADSLTKYVSLTGDRTLLPLIEQAVANKEGLDGNDDDLWALIASLNLYELDHDPSLIQYAQSRYLRLTKEYWDDTCGGGIWWDHERTYKNAITNELLLYAATLLYRTTKDPSYSDWSVKIWNWFDRSGLINSGALINDGLTKQCRNNNQNTYTYNQGVLLGGLAGLYRIDHDQSHITLATNIARATISGLSDSNGVLREPVKDLGQDGQIFKGIFVYHLGRLSPLIKSPADRKVIDSFLQTNADLVWKNRDSIGQIDAYWDGERGLPGAAAQSAGISLFNATVEAIMQPKSRTDVQDFVPCQRLSFALS